MLSSWFASFVRDLLLRVLRLCPLYKNRHSIRIPLVYRPISDVTSCHVTLRTGGQPFTFVYEMAVKQTTKRGLLPGYFEGIQLKETKERYLDKLADIGGQDPYEIPRNEWMDDVDSWPDVTYIHVGMYLLFSSSPYTQDQLMNYKSLDCYQNFANGWVREVFSKTFGENRLLIAKVRLRKPLLF